MNVQNKVIVITGGAGGIGSAQAKLLAGMGPRSGSWIWCRRRSTSWWRS